MAEEFGAVLGGGWRWGGGGGGTTAVVPRFFFLSCSISSFGLYGWVGDETSLVYVFRYLSIALASWESSAVGDQYLDLPK